MRKEEKKTYSITEEDWTDLAAIFPCLDFSFREDYPAEVEELLTREHRKTKAGYISPAESEAKVKAAERRGYENGLGADIEYFHLSLEAARVEERKRIFENVSAERHSEIDWNKVPISKSDLRK